MAVLMKKTRWIKLKSTGVSTIPTESPGERYLRLKAGSLRCPVDLQWHIVLMDKEADRQVR